MAGEITNGGLVATRSNSSPATGSKKEPARTSRLSTPLRAALNRVSRSARSLTSVATTVPECVARCSAWTPQPVPRSSERPTGARVVSWASEVAAELIPRTWSVLTFEAAPSRPGVRSLATHRSTSSAAYGRTSTRARTSPTERSSSPAVHSRSSRSGSARSTSSARTGAWSSHRRVRVSTGLPPRVARSPGRVSLRESAAWAVGPRAWATPS